MQAFTEDWDADEANHTPDGKIKKPSRQTLAHWVKQAWDSIPEQIVRNSFRRGEMTVV
jgi:hypothetical protein